MTPEQKQAAYAARRAAHTRLSGPPLAQFRIMEKDGNERVERFQRMEDAARAYPDAWRIERADRAGFW